MVVTFTTLILTPKAMSDNTNWTDRREGDFPSKDPQKGTPTDEFIETDPNRNAPDSETEDAPTGNNNESNPVTASDDNPIMGTENTFKNTNPNPYTTELKNTDTEEKDAGDNDTIGIP